MKISVITATHNRRDMLRRVFQSLVDQKHDAIEWIIVDDGGTDGSEGVVAEFQRQARFEVRYIRQENAGKPIAVNRGLDMASGEMVCVVDDDDYFLPGVFPQVVRDYAEIARLGSVSRARVSQILNLLALAPSIQEQILFLTPRAVGDPSITERDLRPVVRELRWDRQRELFERLSGW